jgi:hypothetical protein
MYAARDMAERDGGTSPLNVRGPLMSRSTPRASDEGGALSTSHREPSLIKRWTTGPRAQLREVALEAIKDGRNLWAMQEGFGTIDGRLDLRGIRVRLSARNARTRDRSAHPHRHDGRVRRAGSVVSCHARAEGPPRGPAVGALAMTKAAESVRPVDLVSLGSLAPGPFNSEQDRRDWTDNWRTFIASVRINWIMESDWTDPVLFLIYSVAKPLGSLLLLVAMLEIVGGSERDELRSFIVVGSVLWSIVLSGLSGPAWMILDARERYPTIKTIYISPGNFLAVVLGRGSPRSRSGRSERQSRSTCCGPRGPSRARSSARLRPGSPPSVADRPQLHARW